MSIVPSAEIAPLNYFLHSYGPVSMPAMLLGWVFADRNDGFLSSLQCSWPSALLVYDIGPNIDV